MIETKFKDTEVGKIPQDWEVSSLKDVGEINMCKRIMKYQTTEKGDIPFYKIGTFGNKADAYIAKELYEQYKKAYNYPEEGDILLSAAGTIGRTVIFDGKPAYFQDSNIVWIKNDEKLVLNLLLYYIYKIINWITDTGTIPRIYNGNVQSIVFAHPSSLPEQQAIADALSSVDGLIAALEKKIEKKRLIKQGTMQQLLTGKQRLKGFNQPWERKELKSFYNCLKGNGLSKEKLSPLGKFSCMLYGELFTKYTEVIDCVDGRTNYNEGLLSKNNDLLFPGSTTTNGLDLAKASAITIDNIHLGGDIIVYRPKVDIDSKFIAYAMPLYKKEILPYTQGITIVHLKGSDMLNLEVYLPSDLCEQRAIAQILSDMDAEISVLEQKCEKMRSVKQGMMQQLLTGKIRLV